MPPVRTAMDAKAYRGLIESLKLTPYSAGPVLGISHRQSLRYAADGHVPPCIAKLLDMLFRHGIPRDWR